MKTSATASSTTKQKMAEAVFCDRIGGSKRHFGQDLRKCRLAVNATQKKLAKVAGISERCLRQNEHRQVKPHPMTMQLLGEALARLASTQKSVAALVVLLQLAGCGGQGKLGLIVLGLTFAAAALLLSVWSALQEAAVDPLWVRNGGLNPTAGAKEAELALHARWRMSEVTTWLERSAWLLAVYARIKVSGYRVGRGSLLWHKWRCVGPVVRVLDNGALYAECQHCSWPLRPQRALRQAVEELSAEDPRQSVEELEGLSELQEDEEVATYTPPRTSPKPEHCGWDSRRGFDCPCHPEKQSQANNGDVAEHAAPFPSAGLATFTAGSQVGKLEPVMYMKDRAGRVVHTLGITSLSITPKGEA